MVHIELRILYSPYNKNDSALHIVTATVSQRIGIADSLRLSTEVSAKEA